MHSSVCTLFEGDYHFGVAALVNSLYQNGYRGIIWAGYRGALPTWLSDAEPHPPWQEMNVAEGCSIRLIKLDTVTHLTWHKPDFMLALFEQCTNMDSLCYFDPDIVIDKPWSLFEEWAASGVAVCAAPRPSFPSTHPVRLTWRKFYERCGFKCQNEQNVYVNGGFVGITRENIEFLRQWKAIQDPVAFQGTGHPYFLSKEAVNLEHIALFPLHDQDCLNAALEVTEVPITMTGSDAMGFTPGYPFMYHAVGAWKPWRKGIAIKAFRKIRATRKFLHYCNFPIRIYTPIVLLLKKFEAGCAIGPGYLFRLYRQLMWGEECL